MSEATRTVTTPLVTAAPATIVAPTTVPSTPLRPRWRGVLHVWAAAASLPAGVALVALADGSTRAPVAVYALTVTVLFGASAAYHRLPVGPGVRVWLRRVDHAAIFLLIAGSYTPLCVLVLPPALGRPLLIGVWIGALGGAALKLVRLHASNRVGSWLYGVLGWSAVVALPPLVSALGWGAATALIAGGLVYSAGAVVLILRRPDPWPSVFGFHEVWHAAVVVASVIHFGVVAHLAEVV